MKHYFGDASYWIGRIDPDDELHRKAADYTAVIELENGRIFTTQLVLNEVLAPRSGSSARLRHAAIDLIDRITQDPQVSIIPQSQEQFDEAFNLFRTAADDKAWSITDCASFLAMERFGIREALTSDHHFEQYGFVILLQ